MQDIAEYEKPMRDTAEYEKQVSTIMNGWNNGQYSGQFGHFPDDVSGLIATRIMNYDSANAEGQKAMVQYHMNMFDGKSKRFNEDFSDVTHRYGGNSREAIDEMEDRIYTLERMKNQITNDPYLRKKATLELEKRLLPKINSELKLLGNEKDNMATNWIRDTIDNYLPADFYQTLSDPSPNAPLATQEHALLTNLEKLNDRLEATNIISQYVVSSGLRDGKKKKLLKEELDKESLNISIHMIGEEGKMETLRNNMMPSRWNAPPPLYDNDDTTFVYIP